VIDMRTIWKFNIQVTDEQDVKMPRGAELLSVGEQDRLTPTTLQLWALVDPDAEPRPRRIVIEGTGHPTEMNKDQFIGTVLSFGGQLVWHVFDGGER
jgi:hypothetical protein